MHEELNAERRQRVGRLSVQHPKEVGIRWNDGEKRLLTAKAVIVFRVSGWISAGMKVRMKLGTLGR